MTDDLGRKQAERDLKRHEAVHPGCNERYWQGRAEYAEAAAAHFYHCQPCWPGEPCPEGWAYVVALGLTPDGK